MNDPAIYDVTSRNFKPDLPPVKRCLDAYNAVLNSLPSDTREQVRDDVEARSNRVDTRLMLVRQLAGQYRSAKAAASLRHKIAEQGFERVTLYVARIDRRRFRDLAIAMARREGIAIRARADRDGEAVGARETTAGDSV